MGVKADDTPRPGALVRELTGLEPSPAQQPVLHPISIIQEEDNSFPDSVLEFWKSKKKGGRERQVWFSAFFFFFVLREGTGSYCYKQTNLAFSTSAFVTESLLFCSSHNTHNSSCSDRVPTVLGCQGLRVFPEYGTFGAKVSQGELVALCTMEHTHLCN